MHTMKIIVGGIVLAVVLGAVWFFSDSFPGANPEGQTGSVLAPFVVPPLGETYTNSQFGFSVQLPEGFRAQELDDSETGGKTVLLQDAAGNGIQILITPTEEDIPNLSIERVQADIPNMQVRDVQPVEIGESRSGVAFRSDNDAFEGDSREVWFVWQGNLYQISTYARLDALLQSIFGTWQFS